MPKKIELTPKAEIGRGYAVIDENCVEIHISGVMGALKAWLIGRENRPIGNIVNGKLIRNVSTSGCYGLLITQSGKQMFYGGWEDEASETVTPESEETPCTNASISPYSPLPDMAWEKITERSFPSANERVRYTLSNRAFFEAFKKHGYYLFGRDGEKFALAIKHLQGDPAPFPNISEVSEAGEYVYVVL